MTLAAPRPEARANAEGVRSLENPYPLRYPESSSPSFMRRRGWWLLVANLLIPGSAQVIAGDKRLGRFGLGATLALWALIVVAALWALASWTSLASFFVGAWLPDWLSWLRPIPLLIATALPIAYAVLWIVLTLDTLRLVRLVKLRPGARVAVAGVMVGVLVALCGASAWASMRINTVRDGLAGTFAATGPAVAPSDGYYNILLLGADSGDGRDSMRFDSISVVSVNAETGATTITGIPRDMPGFSFSPGPMADLYPNGHVGHIDPYCGWGSGVNQLQTEVEICRDGDALYPEARANHSAPGIEATKDAAEGILGIEIPYYVFLDMDGFAALIDALGGVEITADQRLPKGGGPAWEGQPAEEWAIGWIEPGTQLMDGDTAQWFARSRYTTNDFDRMQRQRQLQQAILAQFTPQTVLARFDEIVQAGVVLVDTDIPQVMIPHFADLAMKAREQPVTALELTPDSGIDEFDPDFDAIHELVQQTLHPPTPTDEPVDGSDG